MTTQEWITILLGPAVVAGLVSGVFLLINDSRNRAQRKDFDDAATAAREADKALRVRERDEDASLRKRERERDSQERRQERADDAKVRLQERADDAEMRHREREDEKRLRISSMPKDDARRFVAGEIVKFMDVAIASIPPWGIVASDSTARVREAQVRLAEQGSLVEYYLGGEAYDVFRAFQSSMRSAYESIDSKPGIMRALQGFELHEDDEHLNGVGSNSLRDNLKDDTESFHAALRELTDYRADMKRLTKEQPEGV